MCSLEEAYNPFIETSSRRTKKKRKTLEPPEPLVIEPDRPAHRRPSDAELLGGVAEPNDEPRSESVMLNALDTNMNYAPHPSVEVKDENVYNLEPDWAKAFNDVSAPEWIKERMPNKAAEVPVVPSPWIDGESSLWQRIPSELKYQAGLQDAKEKNESRIDELQSKLDDMFEKLNSMERTRSESQHIEIILFVLGGLFLLLLLDLLVKQGTRATFYMASAGSLPALALMSSNNYIS